MANWKGDPELFEMFVASVRRTQNARKAIELIASTDRRAATWAACACARRVIHFVPPTEERPLRAIEVAERWAAGQATPDEMRSALLGAEAAEDAALEAERASGLDEVLLYPERPVFSPGAYAMGAVCFVASAAHNKAAFVSTSVLNAAEALAANDVATRTRTPEWRARYSHWQTALTDTIADALRSFPKEAP